jgi:hypothetical protein
MALEEQSIKLRGNSNVFLELSGKMEWIGKTRQESDLLDRHGCAG